MRDAGLGGAPPLPGSCSLTWSYLGVGARSSNSESMAGESRVGRGALSAAAKHRRPGVPNDRRFSLWAPEGASPRSRCPQFNVQDALSPTRRRPPSACLLTWQRASSGLPVTGASPSGPRLALVTPAGPSARTVALGLGLRRAQVSVGHASAGGCALHPERVALHRSLVPSRPTAWLTGQVTSWGASCLLHLSWPSNPRALESGRAGES